MRLPRSFFLLFLLIAPIACCQAQWVAPHGKPVMIDGTLDGGEWNDAQAEELPGIGTVRVKQTEQYLLLAISLNSGDGAVDLYLSPADGQIYDLHASAKLGERKFENGAWPDWTWWNNSGWTANTSRAESFQQALFLPTNTREYQISRSRFPGNRWKLMFEVATPATPNWKTERYPGGATATSTENWIDLELEPLGVKQPGSSVSSCTAPEYHQLDFWIGNWDVFDSDNAKVAVANARISRILASCVVLEEYSQADGMEGKSFNIYDDSRKTWHQSWVTNRGVWLLLDGHLQDGAMVFNAVEKMADGHDRQVRGTWKVVQGGVREIAVRSTDGGKHWTPWFDIVFRPHRE